MFKTPARGEIPILYARTRDPRWFVQKYILPGFSLFLSVGGVWLKMTSI